MLGAVALAGAALGAEHERHRQLAAGHEVRLRRLVDELIERERDEVDEHDLDDGAEARLRRPDGDPAHRALADRRVAHALAAELVRESGGREIRAALGDVLAEDDHALVVAHRARERCRDRLDERGLDHVAYTRLAAISGSGNGLSRANRTAASTSSPASRSICRAVSSSTSAKRAIGSRLAHSRSASGSRYFSGSPS